MRCSPLFAIVIVSSWLGACGSDKAPPAGLAPSAECQALGDGQWCMGGVALECRGGETVREQDCAESGEACVALHGCLACAPNAIDCDGQQLLTCDAQGRGYQPGEVCAQGLSCSPRGCRDLCADARSERSYIGCEYFPVFTSNSQLDPSFRPAVVIANPNQVPAQIAISGAGKSWPQVEIAPQGVQTVMLDYADALEQPLGSAVVRGGAYRLVSSVPVTVHQFNPLLFEVPEDCERPEGDSPLRVVGDHKCNSFSNDASLLLPAHVLERASGEGTSYLAIARATFMPALQPAGPFPFISPGFVAVVAVGERPVHVNVKSTAHTIGSDPDQADGDALPALAPGESLPELTLAPGDVLQLLSGAPSNCPEPTLEAAGRFVCPLGADYDLTGTEIQADGPIEVIAGHNCTNVPVDRPACDHLEETMFPLETWGTEAIAARPRAGSSVPHVLRVLAALDDTNVQFVPEEVHEPVLLKRGQLVEVVATEHVLVRADKPVAVAQFLVGQSALGRVGDPSQSMAIPTEQYRDRYTFLSPDTYAINYVSIIARSGDSVLLDGLPVQDFEPISDTPFQVATLELRDAGAHEVHNERGSGIGVVVYGYGDYTSYMLPGGLDLRVLGTLF